MNLTIAGIEKDIAGFRSMIQTAQNKIDALPTGRSSFKEYKNRERIKRECEAEIKHCSILVLYGKEGILIRQGDTE